MSPSNTPATPTAAPRRRWFRTPSTARSTPSPSPTPSPTPRPRAAWGRTAVEAAKDVGSKAKVATFDTNPQVPAAIRSGALQWAIDQQPYLQGYLAVDSLWLHKTNGNVIGGGAAVLTGPYFI